MCAGGSDGKGCSNGDTRHKNRLDVRRSEAAGLDVSAGAAKNLEEGESIRELVQTQTGQSAAANASAVTNSELMSVQMGAAYRVKVNAGKKRLIFDGTTFHIMGLFGEHADRLHEYVSQSSSARV